MLQEKAKLKLAVTSIVTILLFTTIFIHYTEQWSWVDSFYFSGMTMTTVGYGDLVPTKDLTKVVITLDAIFSIGLFLYALSIIGQIRFRNTNRFENIPKHLTTHLEKGKNRIRKLKNLKI
ncbi:MAG: potassium channel family protein [Nanoarchaeota archaeon]